MNEILAVPAITAICYIAAEAVKVLGLPGKWLPVVCGIVGMVLGVAGIFLMPGFPATDYITAAAIGAVSGLAATGANQILKQIGKDE